MKKSIVVAAALAALGVPLTVGAIEERVAKLEQRVDALERAQAVGAVKAQAWTMEKAETLFRAIAHLQQTAAAPAQLPKQPNGLLTEQAQELSRSLGLASAAAFESRSDWLAGRAQVASRKCDEALAIFNRAAKALGLAERTADSPAPQPR